MKRGQVQGQVFIYILTLIITAGILLYGYNTIKVINEKANQVELISFKDALKQDFEKMSSDYGSSETETYTVPPKIKEICFYQKDVSEPENPSESINIDNPLIKDSITDTDNNVFLVFNDNAMEPMKLARIEVSEGQILCININSNRLKLKLEGLGDGVAVEQA